MNIAFTPLVGSLETRGAADILKYGRDPKVIPLSAGSPAAEALPSQTLAELAAKIFQETPAAALQYGPTDGYGPLREFLPSFLKESYGIGGENDRVLITAGAQQVMWLTALSLCGPGDVILCEDPSFVGSLNAFRASGAKLVGLPVEEDGLDTRALEAALQAHPNAKLLYTIPSFQNPTGITMSEEKRRRVYALAQEHDILIVEDNPYGDLYFDCPFAPIKALDTDGRVIYAGSFSKVIAPGLRVGYALADAALVETLGQVKLCDDVHTAALPQMLCHRFLTECDFAAHLEGLRTLYAKKAVFAKDCFARHLAPYGFTCAPAHGGLFLWLTVPSGIDAREFCTVAVRDYAVGVASGAAFALDPDAPVHSFRVNFSAPGLEAIAEGFARLEQCAKAIVG